MFTLIDYCNNTDKMKRHFRPKITYLLTKIYTAYLLLT